jgi:hypothetical protein
LMEMRFECGAALELRAHRRAEALRHDLTRP